MNILDENILESQRQILHSQRVPIRQIGYDVGRKGMKDDEIIPFLRSPRRPTFFTRDLCHARYCLVCMAVICMAVRRNKAAAFVRRFCSDILHSPSSFCERCRRTPRQHRLPLVPNA